MDYTEVSAKTVDEAITKACIELGLSSDQLDIEVISEGTSGFLGFGSKPAVIKARKKISVAEEEAAAEIDIEGIREAVREEKAAKEEQKPEQYPENVKPEKKEAVPKPARGDSSEKKEEKLTKKETVKTDKIPEKKLEKKEIVKERSEEEIVTMKASASKFLENVFKAMNLPVNITMEYDSEAGSLDIDFEGEDMGILIGKRGQTLDSLQYLVSLVVNRDVENYVRIKLDTENYRSRRKETLENLAGNIARKVKKTRKPVSLEPMNPYERRIIHSALQNNRFVETYSEGNEPYRHVVIAPKK